MYVPAADSRALLSEGEDVAKWVRELVRYALSKKREVRGVA